MPVRTDMPTSPSIDLYHRPVLPPTKPHLWKLRTSQQEGWNWWGEGQRSRDSLHMRHLMWWKPCINPWLQSVLWSGYTYCLSSGHLHLEMNTLQQGVGTHRPTGVKLTFTCLPIKLERESNRAAAVNSSRCVFTCTITATIIYCTRF